MPVVKYLLGDKGRETRADLRKGWSHSFYFLIIEVGSLQASGEIPLLIASTEICSSRCPFHMSVSKNEVKVRKKALHTMEGKGSLAWTTLLE